ncbi:MAG: TetR/AcrR family transcriptional regulator [Lachnospiraceae bacterium]|jgi:AcrR family transcriptional regulator|nr:TetR/AcrR family transcriptional regulator [Lachnospiraceae bacterium]
MNEKFFDLKTEKQDRMINASLKVFARNGYQYASTDEIVKEAAISKGLLFHYFGSKLGLFVFLADYAVRYMKMEIVKAVNEKETDYFAILKSIEVARLAALRKFPHMQAFLYSLVREDDAAAVKATKEQRANLKTLQEDMLKNADYSRFRAEAEAADIEKWVSILLEGLMKENMKGGTFKAERYYNDAVKCIDMLGSLVRR